MRSIIALSLTPVLAVALVACNSEPPDNATMTLAVTDAPVDGATAVVVEFTGVAIQPSDGSVAEFEFDSPRQIDLLALEGSASEVLLDSVTLKSGRYNWIRLDVNAGMNASDSFVELEDGSRHALFIPSGNETGLKLVQGFNLPANGSADFTIDFDLRKSVVDPEAEGTPFILRPALRLVDNTEVGHLTGIVSDSIAADESCQPAVYVYEGAGIDPDDVGSSGEPVASGTVAMDDTSGDFTYEVGFLLAGDYTAALTCEADADDPETDDAIAFQDQADVTIQANQTTQQDFPAS